jgi:hypothetical protein
LVDFDDGLHRRDDRRTYVRLARKLSGILDDQRRRMTPDDAYAAWRVGHSRLWHFVCRSVLSTTSSSNTCTCSITATAPHSAQRPDRRSVRVAIQEYRPLRAGAEDRTREWLATAV